MLQVVYKKSLGKIGEEELEKLCFSTVATGG